MLGQDLVAALRTGPGAREVTAADLDSLDITDPDACLAAVAGHDIVVNAAAWTKVDEAETREAQALTVNALGAANLARACAAAGARMVRVSTDYVFAGEATSPHAEDAPLAPRGRLMVGPRLLGSGPCERTCPPTGKTTWFGFAQEIFRLLGHDPAKVLPTTSEAFTRPAPRPTYSVLGHDHWTTVGVAPIRAWSDALAKSVTTVVGG